MPMKYSRTPLVRCYNFEARKNEDGETVIKQPVGTIQRLDVLVNMALYCLDVGADSVTVFADGILPYARSFGICQEEQAQMRVNPDENTLRINRPHYSPKSYSVIIAMDSEDNLPTAIRRYVSMVSDEPTLIYVFSRPYMMRDYYMSHIDELWSVDLSTNIPVESNSARDVAQKILARISSGGITAESLIALCAGSEHFDELVNAGDVHGILREILAIYGKKEDRIRVYKYFQYSSLLAFDENGFYNPAIKIYLSENNLLYRIISGRHMVQMVNEEEGDKEYPLPIPCGRLTQHIIERQNLLYEGKLYTVQYVDATAGKIVVSQSRGGAQLVVYQ